MRIEILREVSGLSMGCDNCGDNITPDGYLYITKHDGDTWHTCRPCVGVVLWKIFGR